MSKIGAVIVGIGCSIWLVSCIQSDRDNLRSGKVIRVVSGQTIEVRLSDSGEVSQVRIVGIDAPDLRQSPWGEAAKQKLVELTVGLPIQLELESEKRDRYNRFQAHIWQDDTLVSQQLVLSGYVLADDRFAHSYSKLLMESQEYARLMGYGIWNPQQAMRLTPSQFRSMKKP